MLKAEIRRGVLDQGMRERQERAGDCMHKHIEGVCREKVGQGQGELGSATEPMCR